MRDDPSTAILSDEERSLLDKIAARIAELRLATPAIFLLETLKPMNFIGSQMIVFLMPVLSAFGGIQELHTLARILEKRGSIESLIQIIERLEHESEDKNSAAGQAHG